MSVKKQPFAQEVWEKLSKINVNKHTEKKGSLTYLSWSWAWATLMENYPLSFFEFRPVAVLDDGTAEVWCSVTIVSEEGDAVRREMWLPVMDHKNNSVKNPTSRQINDCRMRCLTKCLALFGLGLYIYAGEDVPGNHEPEQDGHITDGQFEQLIGLLDETKSDKEKFCRAFKVAHVGALLAKDFDRAVAMIERKRQKEIAA